MMKARLLGIRKLDFKPPDGDPVKGTQIFIAYSDDSTLGEMAEKKFFPEGFELPTLNPGEMLDLDCTIKGKIVGVKVIQGTTPSPIPTK